MHVIVANLAIHPLQLNHSLDMIQYRWCKEFDWIQLKVLRPALDFHVNHRKLIVIAGSC